MPDIHVLAAPPWERDLFVAGALTRAAFVCSAGSGEVLAAFDTVLDFGGRRLCLVTGATPVVVAGAWGRRGVGGYSLSGELLWQDRTRSDIQFVTALSAGRVAIGYARGPGRLLAAATGEEIRSLRGVTQVIATSPDTSVLVNGSYVRLADADLEPTTGRIALPPSAPVVLGAAAGPGLVALATMQDGVWLLDHEGARHRAVDIPGVQALQVACTDGGWEALTRTEQAGEPRFDRVRFTSGGHVVDRSPLPPVDDAVWLDDGRILVLANEDGVFALDTPTGPARRLIGPT